MNSKTFHGRSICCPLVPAALCLILAAFALHAETPQAISLRNPAALASHGGGGNSEAPLMTPDGRYVLFASTAGNLATNLVGQPFASSAGPVLNVYWRDRLGQTTRLITPDAGGIAYGNNDSLPAALSTNGMLALLESRASNLVPNDTNSVSDVFVRDVAAGQTRLVSVATNNIPGNGGSYNAVMSADGRYVAFTSEADNLVANDTNGLSDVFLRDMESGVTTLISLGVPPEPAIYTNLGADLAQITPDGLKIAFASKARNITIGGITTSILVRDRNASSTVWASSEAANVLGIAGVSEVTCFDHVLSEDGAYLAYQAKPTGTSLTPSAVLRYRLGSGITDVIHMNALVVSQTTDDVQNLDISADGSRVAFLVATDVSASGVMVWDAASGLATLASVNLRNDLTTNSTCHAPRLDPLGKWVVFLSSAGDLVTNVLSGTYHLYKRDLAVATTTLLNVDDSGVVWPLTTVTIPIVSSDARLVAFESIRRAPPWNLNSDVYVIDTQTGAAELVSQHVPSLPSATGSGLSLPPSIAAASGPVVAYASASDNLVLNDGNTHRDVFLRDLRTGTNLLLSADPGGVPGNAPSFDPIISANGSHVAFTSFATNLVTGDRNSNQDVFVRDLKSSTGPVLVSVAWNGAPANSNSLLTAISQDGRYILFRSFAGNLAANQPYGEKLYVRDMLQGTNFALTSGVLPYEFGVMESFYYGRFVPCSMDMTPDGRFIAYVNRYTSWPWRVSVWDLQAGKNVVSNNIPGFSPQIAIAPDARSYAWLSNNANIYSTILQRIPNTSTTLLAAVSSKDIRIRFSGDSRWCVYNSIESGKTQLYLYDLVNRTNLLVSRNSSGAPASGNSDSPALSPDGRFIAFRSFASDIVPGDTNGVPDVFLFDRVSGTTLLLSCNDSGQPGNHHSGAPSFSADGTSVIFSSWASNLHPLDFNQTADLFAYTLVPFERSFYLQTIGSGGQLKLLWPAIPGKTYRVLFKNDLSETGWQTATGPVLINGDHATYTDPGNETMRVFQVVEE